MSAITHNTQGPTGDDWQAYARGLIPFIHGYTEYVVIPDAHLGDLGIELYTFDGAAYQCYADQDSKNTKDRYEKQRDKLTEDIGKFCKRRSELQKLLGLTRISSWIFCVPKSASRQLVRHAAEKTKEVRALNLPYATKDFKIVVKERDDLLPFETMAQRAATAIIELEKPIIGEAEIDKRIAAFEANLKRKFGKLYPEGSDSNREDHMRALIKENAISENLLEELQSIPQTYAKLMSEILSKEKRLANIGTSASANPKSVLVQELEDLAQRIERAAPDLGADTRESIVQGTITGWLMLCPLDFDVSSN